MAIEQTLVPAFVNFVYGGDEWTIVDAQFSLFYSNESKYEESMTSAGTKGYLLRKGTTVDQDGDISIRITCAGDGKANDVIKKIEDISKNISTKENPKDYCKDIVITFKDPGEEKFFSVSFNGYLKNFYMVPQEKNNFTDYIADFEIFDPATIKLS